MEEHRQDKGRRLNWRQACAILGCGKNVFYRMIRSGQLPAYKMQGSERGLWVYEADCRRLVRPVPLCPQNGAKP